MRVDRPIKIDGAHIFSMLAATQPGQGDHYSLHTPEKVVTRWASSEPYSASTSAVAGSYAMLFPSPWGSAGVVALDDGYLLETHAKAGNGAVLLSMNELPRGMGPKGRLSYRYLVVQGRANEPSNATEWERFVLALGLRGKPAYQVSDVKVGRVTSTKFLLELVPYEYGFVGTVTQADLPIRLPVRVAGMNPNWTFAWFDLGRNEWYPSAVDRKLSQGYFTLDTRRGAHRFFAGHAVVVDNPDVRMSVFYDAKSKISAIVNNISDAALKVKVRLNPALGNVPVQTIQLAPGEMKQVAFAWTTATSSPERRLSN